MNAKRSSQVKAARVPNRDPSLGSKGAGTAVSFRLARRIAIQSPGRSILVAALIAIPVIGLSAFVTVNASNARTTADTIRFDLGKTQAVITVVSAPDPTLRQSVDGMGTSNSGTPPASNKPFENPSTYLPSGTRILPIRSVAVTLHTATGIATVPSVEGQPWNPSFSGIWDVVAGRTPRSNDEIMVSPGALSRLGAKLGSTVSILRPVAQTVTIVGVLKSAAMTNQGVGIYGRSAAFDGLAPSTHVAGTSYFLPDHVVPWQDIRTFNAHGAIIESRSALLNPPPTNSGFVGDDTGGPNLIGILFVGIIGGFALFEVALLAGAAFAVGARQQQRALAVLASVGGDARILFRVISFGGILIGLVGSIVGISLGLVGAQVFMTIEADGQASRFPSFHIDWVALAAIILLAVIAAWTAAAVPARAASRLDIVGALRGASRPPKPTRRRPVVGVALLLIGLVIALAGGLVIVSANLHGYNQSMSSIGIALLVTGPVTMQIGAALIAPLILRWSASLFSRFGASARLGARDAARNPSRSVPVLSAIMSTVFVASFVIAILGGTQASAIATHIYTTPQNSVTVSLYGYSDAGKNILEPVGSEVITAVNRAFGGTTARILSSAPDPDGGQAAGSGPFAVPRTHGAVPFYLQSFTASSGDKIWVGSAADLAAVLGEPATPQALSAYENGGVVAFYSQLVQHGNVTIDWSKDAVSRKITRSSSLPAVLQQPKHEYDFGLFLSPQTAASIGLKYAPSTVFDQLRSAPTDAQQDSLSESLTGIGTGDLDANWETGPAYFAQAWGWALVLLTALIALAAATIATALARADGRRDDAVLGAVGAAPGVRRAFGFWQAVILTGIGSIVGVVLGLVPAFALSIRTGPHAAAQILPFAPSWMQLLITALAIPLLIAAGSWLTAGRARVRYNVRAPIG